MKEVNNKNGDNKPSKTYYRICITMFATVIGLSIVLFVFNFIPMSEQTYKITYLEGITRIEYENGDIIEYPNTISGLSSSFSEISRQNPKIPQSSQTPVVTEKININTASSVELQQLDGIGESRAAAIIRYREEKGGFKTIEEVLRVEGIGEATFQKFRDMITV